MSNMSTHDAGLLPCGLSASEVPHCPHFVSLPGPKTSQKKLIESSYMDTRAGDTYRGRCLHVCVSEDGTAACDSEEVNNKTGGAVKREAHTCPVSREAFTSGRLQVSVSGDED